MAYFELDFLVRGTGIGIIVIFVHTYLMAENGTQYEVAKDQDEEDSFIDQEDPKTNSKLSDQQNGPTSKNKPINEIQDDENDNSEI